MFAAIPSLPRAALARLTTRMIDRMDEIDGDADLELTGDETDSAGSEDEFYQGDKVEIGPGCPIADPDCCLCQEDIGTKRRARKKIGFDLAHADDDAEEGGDLEPRQSLGKAFYGVDQSRGPMPSYPLPDVY